MRLLTLSIAMTCFGFQVPLAWAQDCASCDTAKQKLRDPNVEVIESQLGPMLGSTQVEIQYMNGSLPDRIGDDMVRVWERPGRGCVVYIDDETNSFLKAKTQVIDGVRQISLAELGFTTLTVNGKTRYMIHSEDGKLLRGIRVGPKPGIAAEDPGNTLGGCESMGKGLNIYDSVAIAFIDKKTMYVSPRDKPEDNVRYYAVSQVSNGKVQGYRLWTMTGDPSLQILAEMRLSKKKVPIEQPVDPANQSKVKELEASLKALDADKVTATVQLEKAKQKELKKITVHRKEDVMFRVLHRKKYKAELKATESDRIANAAREKEIKDLSTKLEELKQSEEETKKKITALKPEPKYEEREVEELVGTYLRSLKMDGVGGWSWDLQTPKYLSIKPYEKLEQKAPPVLTIVPGVINTKIKLD